MKRSSYFKLVAVIFLISAIIGELIATIRLIGDCRNYALTSSKTAEATFMLVTSWIIWLLVLFMAPAFAFLFWEVGKLIEPNEPVIPNYKEEIEEEETPKKLE